ncbi:MAG: 4Fe-4S dicluster domain-containing protein [Deltaproteobacteria bacterium]|nr:4Fe-4S dicluster domain-containing protein [Deltaproteobacteria bacterium]
MGKRMKETEAGLGRREFLKLAGVASAGLGLAHVPGAFWLGDAVAAIPAAGGYLLVDTKKCQGCTTCMMACSLTHEGKASLSLSRIQVVQNPFERFPDDLRLVQCRQCVEPPCVEACPTGALRADPARGIRTVRKAKCIGCRACVEACRNTPSTAIWNFEGKHAQVCDLCADAPYWGEKGGPAGTQACVATCPVGAIRFTKEIPVQKGDAGYRVNLRGKGWKALGYTTE